MGHTCLSACSDAVRASCPSKYRSRSCICRAIPDAASGSSRSSSIIWVYASSLLSPPLVRRRLTGGTSPLWCVCWLCQWVKKEGTTHRAELSNRSECSLNFLMRGRAPRCRPACIVISFWLPVYFGVALVNKRKEVR